MADKPISGLPAATQVLDNSLFVMEQSQQALSVTGGFFQTGFCAALTARAV